MSFENDGTFTHTIDLPDGFQFSISIGSCVPPASVTQRSAPSAAASEYVKPLTPSSKAIGTWKSVCAALRYQSNEQVAVPATAPSE